jgi:ketosteroid isomerase-like protein
MKGSSMKMSKIVSAGFASTLTVAAASGAADELTPVERELMALENSAMERWRQGDPMLWVETSAPEVTYVDPGLTKPIVGVEEYRRYMESLKGKIHYEGSEFMRPKAAVYGDVAVLTYNYQGSTREADGSLKRHPAWDTTEVYVRVGGAWKIIHTHWSHVRHVVGERVEVPVPVEKIAPNRTPLLEELLRLEAAAMERYRKGDPFGFTDISVPNVTYFDSRTPGRVDGLAALKDEMARRAGKIHYDVMDFVDPMVQVHGATAVLFYRFFSTSLRPDGAVAARTPWNCTEVFAKVNGQWRIVHTHWSLIGGHPEQEQGPAGLI